MELSHENKPNESSLSSSFCKTNIDYKEKWTLFLKKENFYISKDTTPLELTPHFEELESDELRRKFYLGFMILVAECQITFEQLIMLTKKLQENEPTYTKALKKFCEEEYIHSITYRHFLNHCEELNWKENSLVVENNSLIRKLLYFWVKRFPKSLYLVGAKSEIFSLCYSKLVEKHLPENDEWRILNKYHLEDEVHHIPFAMKLHKEFHKKAELHTIFSTYVMFALVQFLNITTSYKLIGKIYPNDHFFKRISKTFKLAKWIIRDFVAYQETRKILKANMKKFSMPSIYNLMAR